MTNNIFLTVLCVITTQTLITVAFPQKVVSKDDSIFELKIIHNNDMHGRFDETDERSSVCSPENVMANKCYGGFPRVAHEVKRFREQEQNSATENVLFLNAGDTYTGTVWFTLFKENITSTLLNLLRPDVMSLGNHEFDEGIESLETLLSLLEFPTVVSNLNFDQAPQFNQLANLMKYIVIEKRERKIGVIGYLTPETKHLAPPTTIGFEEEIEHINKAADELIAQGVNIIIALGHSGFDRDIKIAEGCPNVDIVVGGHSNTFLWNGDKPDSEEVFAPYPFVVERNGKKVPVVQAYAYTKYLGEINLRFNSDGDLLEFSGQPILLDGPFEKDAEMLAALEVYRPEINKLQQEIVGQTKVLLDGNSLTCRRKECNMGNLIADSMIYENVIRHQAHDGYWTDASIAFLQGGGIRASVDVINHRGNISVADIYAVLPFNSFLTKIEISGATIRQALEHSVELYNLSGDARGEFLQMSGVRVSYDLTLPSHSRVQSVEVLCAKCAIPRYEPLDDAKTYKVLITTFLAEGGDEFVMFETDTAETMTVSDFEAFKDYIEKLGVVYPGVEGRVKLKYSNPASGNNSGTSIIASAAVLVLSFIFKLSFGSC